MKNVLNKLVVINSLSLKRLSSRKAKKVLEYLKSLTMDGVHLTEYPGHAGEIVKNSGFFPTIVAAGGDGTISEIVNSMDLDQQALEIVPIGTGNSLARHLGLVSKPFHVPSSLVEKRIDLVECRIGSKGKSFKIFSASTTSLGYVANVTETGSKHLKWARNMCYPIAAFLETFRMKKNISKIRTDPNGPLKKAVFTNLMVNNSSYSGNFKVFKEARLDDSRFDLVLANSGCSAQILTDIRVLAKKTNFESDPNSEMVQLSYFNVALDVPGHFMLDGEMIKDVGDVTFSIIPKKLRLRIPK